MRNRSGIAEPRSSAHFHALPTISLGGRMQLASNVPGRSLPIDQPRCFPPLSTADHPTTSPSHDTETDMSHAKLFEPLSLGSLTLANRIVIAPMCQYSAVDGCMTDWHITHLGHLAQSGAALLTI